MGSLLSGVLACIYLEFLESGPFKYIIPNTAHYFRYIDDILLIYLQDLDLQTIIDRPNNVEPSVKFTYELEYNSTLPFLDILLIRNINKLGFKVYRKPTCRPLNKSLLPLRSLLSIFLYILIYIEKCIHINIYQYKHNGMY